MIKHCYQIEKIKRIVLGSGGSAFVDGGLGAMFALDVFNFKLKSNGVL
jgi:glycerate kinase